MPSLDSPFLTLSMSFNLSVMDKFCLFFLFVSAFIFPLRVFGADCARRRRTVKGRTVNESYSPLTDVQSTAHPYDALAQRKQTSGTCKPPTRPHWTPLTLPPAPPPSRRFDLRRTQDSEQSTTGPVGRSRSTKTKQRRLN